jgi:hypothetical protein
MPEDVQAVQQVTVNDVSQPVSCGEQAVQEKVRRILHIFVNRGSRLMRSLRVHPYQLGIM